MQKTGPQEMKDLIADNDMDRLACLCMEKLLPSMNEDYALLIRELELQQQPTKVIARKLNITPANLKVKRHRARMQLKQRLQQTCRLCAKHGCLDCDCSN
jgi:RNA polymerase sigma-70 factor (ECF subfamily)